MRLYPLIPLICVAMGAVLFETVLTLPDNRAFRDFSMEIEDSMVNSTSEGLQADFRARQLSMGPRTSMATNVSGMLKQDGISRRFSADKLSSDTGSGIIYLDGNVTMAEDEGELVTDMMQVKQDGTIEGGKVHLRIGDSVIFAEGFSQKPGEGLVLEAGVQGTLAN